ncbi:MULTISPECIES: hypothetical protein [unclassified Rhizobium]|uniref:hypothetical protein n=1 Tax=unclassified Rhizobium TaxID=2613769 RepID=UPI0009E879AC|nr:MULTISPECIES: hypothetical protein [unclassified Rhizobium]
MIHYAWTIEAKGRKPIQKVTTVACLVDVLRILDLPGVAPTDWVAFECCASDHGKYTHNEGGDDEWSLKWTSVTLPGG